MRIFAFIIFAFTCLMQTSTANATEAAWLKLADGGYTVLMRHARAPGTGDPANFELGKCNTQRNLSARGRQQAQRIGARLAARAIVFDKILTSQWCRTIETAKLVFSRDEIIEFPALNSFYQDRSTEAEQTAEVIKAIRDYSGFGNQIMVTHQVNITALTGITPREGESIIVGPDPDTDGIKVFARLIVN